MPKITVQGATQEELMDTLINIGVAQLQIKNMHIEAQQQKQREENIRAQEAGDIERQKKEGDKK